MPIYKLFVKGVSILQSSPFGSVVCTCVATGDIQTFRNLGMQILNFRHTNKDFFFKKHTFNKFFLENMKYKFLFVI